MDLGALAQCVFGQTTGTIVIPELSRELIERSPALVSKGQIAAHHSSRCFGLPFEEAVGTSDPGQSASFDILFDSFRHFGLVKHYRYTYDLTIIFTGKFHQAIGTAAERRQ